MQGVCCPLLHVIKKYIFLKKMLEKNNTYNYYSLAAYNKKKIFLKQMLEENNTLSFLKKFICIILFQHLLKKDFFFFITCSNGQQTPCMAAGYGEKDRRSKHNGCKLYRDSIEEEVRRNGG